MARRTAMGGFQARPWKRAASSGALERSWTWGRQEIAYAVVGRQSRCSVRAPYTWLAQVEGRGVSGKAKCYRSRRAAQQDASKWVDKTLRSR